MIRTVRVLRSWPGVICRSREKICQFIAMVDLPDVTIMYLTTPTVGAYHGYANDLAPYMMYHIRYSVKQASFDPPRIYSFVCSSTSPVNAFLFVWIRSCLLSRAALVLSRLACISSFRIRSRCFSAFALWICRVACQRKNAADLWDP